ncbi:Diaminopimelate epimerase [Alkaliphilus metalliredigens QYMF]|uniref:Diaminopimelate epimerase n=1 Tax=Alkaliphilus metalliredigens (strain QYMF) TaxID=293826 RepID=DAPF_ALKMQ|nr:diaminopimelate epimerase [Alkaliphilus metalliredigens]A6TRX5.1 RecName: Full=Diaminopimelate epimerase; Short=DAP epimerase; AltName: Full=PLP-independent amino acid racemase [Alkaliphilus metalliredigens QYMF]ABR48943.1 Diaminopimelate epimerase [Alkaliphilus metalliredigens QYMF]
MEIKFKKMHGTGNDFIMIYYEDYPFEQHFNQLAKEVCHRHFGIGADGLMIVKESSVADVQMKYFNSDGSEAGMCGNGIRCFAKFVYDEGLVKKEIFTVETLSGVKELQVATVEEKVSSVRVNMGKMVLDPKQIPVNSEGLQFINEQLMIDGEKYTISTVLLGVPHTIIFMETLDLDRVKRVGKIIENHQLFPENTNVNFAQIINQNTIRVRTWERGAGYTLACGTGVSSVCGIANHLSLVGPNVVVEIEGGKLDIEIAPEGDIYMEGPAKDICKGVYLNSLIK